MSLPIAEARLRDVAECRYVLFIEGLPYAFTDDTGFELTGGDGGSWIGISQADIGGAEAVAGLERTVLPGLTLPGSLRIGGNPKGTGLQRSSGDFKILDHDGLLGTVFSQEADEFDILHGHIPAGVSAIADGHIGEGPNAVVGVVGVRGRYVDLERIGPGGQRRCWPAIPTSTGLVGYEHTGDSAGRTPNVVVTDQPIAHEGRMVALYRIYKNPAATSSSGALDWYPWSDHFPNDLVWFGTMRDTATYTGDGVWQIKCLGPESLLERGLGRVTDDSWHPITAALTLNPGTEDQIFVTFGSGKLPLESPAGNPFNFEGREWTSITAISRQQLIDEINTLIVSTSQGTGTDYDLAEDGTYESWSQITASPSAGIDTTGFWIQSGVGPTLPRYGRMYIAMHRKAWIALGYEPESQFSEGFVFEDEETLEIRRLDSGQAYSPGAGIASIVPGSDYWACNFTTVPLGVSRQDNANDWDNHGARRYYLPRFRGLETISIIESEGKQNIRLGGDESPFFEPQITAPVTSTASVGGVACDASRYFVLRGKIQNGDINNSGNLVISESEDKIAVCRASWAQTSTYGQVGSDGIRPGLYIERYYDPRLFGFPHKPLDRDWVSTNAGDYQVEITPLYAYAYSQSNTPELAHQLFTQVMLSTGSCLGFDGAVDSGGTLAPGDNNYDGLFWGGDIESADMALGIPHQLMAPDIGDQFALVTGGKKSHLNRMRLAFHGAYRSQDVIEAILRPRRMLIGLDGKRFGVYRLGRFSPDEATIRINDSDIHGNPRNPDSTRPKQTMRAFGALDEAVFSYGYEPGSGSKLSWSQGALDPGARRRRGDLVEDISGRGLVPTDWIQDRDYPGNDWKTIAREEWGHLAAEVFSLRHDLIEIPVSRPKGQDLMPGTKVLLTNQWMLGPDGAQGVTSLVGQVISVQHKLGDHSCLASILVFAGQSNPIPHFAPIVYLSSISGSTLTYKALQSGYGRGDLWSDNGLAEPDWSEVGGNATLRIWYQLPGGEWSTSGTQNISSVDTTARTITLTGSLSSEPPADTCTMIAVFDDFDDQADPSYVRELYAPIVDADGTYGAGPTQGKRWP